MISAKLTFIKASGDRKICRFDLPIPDGSGDYTEFRGRTVIVREDGSHLETPHIEHFATETEAVAWLNGE